MNSGLLGAIVGLLGGAVGTYLSIKNTSRPKERRFMLKTALVLWIVLGVMVFLLFIIPIPQRWLLWIPFFIVMTAMPFAILAGNKRQAQIRSEEKHS